MTKTQRMLAAFALAGAAAGLAAPAASAAPASAPIALPDLPAAAPGMPAGAQPTSVAEIGAKLGEGANQLNQLMTVPDQLAPLIAPAEPVLGLAGAIQ
ncbi:hypothetical protein [Streptomyces sp. NBC_00091]|uniref:hypothetical protein n=1 Tax=Streptomyces sp. NBC_00091 TaxID=2975648 RepID=UPI00225774A8|nr:hypothetical protein [Streptomyces sp. NBC_00091]MCX5377081.1 hypothetical protein [Streptomyces sp. NBC_00091]